MVRRSDEDLFQESTMTFGEHLEELRGALFRAVIGLAIGFLIGCIIANYVVEWIQEPVLTALEDYEYKHAKNKLKEQFAPQPIPPEVEQMLDAGYVPEDEMLIEPFGLLSQLQQDFPDQFIFEFTPHKFTPDDIRPPTSSTLTGATDPPLDLAKRLVEQSKQDDSPGRELWERLSAADQDRLEKLAGADESTDQDRAALASMLNRVIDNTDLHQSEALESVDTFEDRVTRDGVAELRAQREELGEEFPEADARRLNRLLVAAYLFDYVRPPRLNVVKLPTWRPLHREGLQSLRAEEAFMIWIKAALVAGAVISSPWIFYQVWIFVASGLYAHERKYVYLYLPVSLTLFLSGALLAFYFVFKPVLGFLFGFNEMMNIEPDLRIGEWLGFVLFLPIGFGISFQLPLVMLFLNRIGIFSVEMYIEKWRIAVMVIAVLSMFLTPADPVSMLLMAGPLTLLYFGGIGMCRWMPKGRSPFDEGYEPS